MDLGCCLGPTLSKGMFSKKTKRNLKNKHGGTFICICGLGTHVLTLPFFFAAHLLQDDRETQQQVRFESLLADHPASSLQVFVECLIEPSCIDPWVAKESASGDTMKKQVSLWDFQVVVDIRQADVSFPKIPSRQKSLRRQYGGCFVQ